MVPPGGVIGVTLGRFLCCQQRAAHSLLHWHRRNFHGPRESSDFGGGHHGFWKRSVALAIGRPAADHSAAGVVLAPLTMIAPRERRYHMNSNVSSAARSVQTEKGTWRISTHLYEFEGRRVSLTSQVGIARDLSGRVLRFRLTGIPCSVKSLRDFVAFQASACC